LLLFVFVLCLVYPLLPVSLDCPFCIAPSVFNNVYLKRYVTRCWFIWIVYLIEVITYQLTIPNGTYTTWFPQNKSIIKPKCFDRLYCFWYIHDTRRDVPIFKFLWTVKLRSKCDIWFTGVLWYDILLSTIAIDVFYLTNSNYYIITNHHACASLRHGNKVMVMYFMMKTNPFLVQHLLA
jgi:hypothetical protein